MLRKNSLTQQRICPVWFHLYKIPEKTDLIYSDRKQISGCLELEGLSEKQYKGIFWDKARDLYLDCILLVVTWVYKLVRTHQNANFEVGVFYWIKSKSKLIWKKKHLENRRYYATQISSWKKAIYRQTESEFPGNPSLQNALTFWKTLILRAAHRLRVEPGWCLWPPGDPLYVLSHRRSWEFCSSPRWRTSPPLPSSAALFHQLHLSLLHLSRTPIMWSSSHSATQLFTQGPSLLKVHRNGPHDPLCFHWFCNSTSRCCGTWGGSGLPFWFQRTSRTQERMRRPPVSRQPPTTSTTPVILRFQWRLPPGNGSWSFAQQPAYWKENTLFFLLFISLNFCFILE